MKFETKAIHADVKDDQHGAVWTPIYQSSTFRFENADDGAQKFLGQIPGHIYTRISNPTIRAFETCMASLEGAEDAFAFSSGMAAIHTLIASLTDSKSHVISGRIIYGGTHKLFNELMPRSGTEFTFVDTINPDNVKNAIKENTKVIYLETPANPTMELADIKEISEIAKSCGAKLIVDNTFATPFLQNPLKLGADAVVHSATKYIGGHSDIIGGVAVGSADIINNMRPFAFEFGGCMGLQEAWLATRGLRTLSLRMERHEKNAIEVAKFLESHPKVNSVKYPGLQSHPQHELAKRQMSGFGGMISFDMGTLDAGKALVNSTKLCTLAVSLGCVKSLIEHPASMTHSPVPKEAREEFGITDGLIRLSVGIENVEDIIADLSQALDKVKM